MARDNLKPDKGLEAAQAAEAVSASVAARLHADAARIQTTWAARGEDVEGTMEAISDEGLRADLAKALASNGKVDAEGELLIERKSLPPVVQMMRKRLLTVVEAAIAAIPRQDSTGAQHLPSSTAAALAAGAVRGRIDWPAWTKAAKEMMGSAAAPTGSLDEMRDAFKLLRAAWLLVAAVQFASQRDSGIEKIESCLNSSARAQVAELDSEQERRHAGQLTAWLQRILGSWGDCVDEFRRASAEQRGARVVLPSVAQCVQAWEGKYHFQSTVVALLAATKAQAKQRAESTTIPQSEQRERALKNKERKEVAKERRSKGEADRKAKKQRPAREGGSPAMKFSAQQWAEIPTKFPKVCRFFLKGDCSRADCKFKHEKPADFDAWMSQSE
jgi:hypothetical protein